MISRFIFTLFTFYISHVLAIGQRDASLPPNAEVGKCYAQCLIDPTQRKIRYDEVTYPIYIGSDPSVKTEIIVLTLQVPETISRERTWPDCIRTNDDNCTYIEEEYIPGIYETIQVPQRRRKIPKEDIIIETFKVAFEEISHNNWEEVVSYPVYIGTDAEVLTVTKNISIGGETRWEKKKADRNCISSDPNDCLVWCLVQIPPEIKTINYIPIDLKEIPLSDIAFRTIRAIKKGVITEWRQVLCGNQVTKSLIYRLRKSLLDRGYQLSGSKDRPMDQDMRSALVKYQKENGLPIGALDFETLNSLNIAY